MLSLVRCPMARVPQRTFLKPASTFNTTGLPALEFFSFTSANNLGAVSMIIDWTRVENNAQQEMIGLLGAATVSSSSGEFIPEFPLDSSVTANVNFPMGMCSLTDPTANAMCNSEISQAFFTEFDRPVNTPVPEPRSILILVTGFAFLIWRKRAEELPDEP
jgi:hypothetical protein